MKLFKTHLVFILLFITPFLTFADKSQYPLSSTGAIYPTHGEALILIPAFPTDRMLWNPQVLSHSNWPGPQPTNTLDKYFDAIPVSLHGFEMAFPGDTGKAITMDEYAASIKGLLDSAGIKKAIIGGESMGGYVALAFYKNYPDRTAGLILSDTQAIADTPEMKARREKVADYILKHGTSKLANDFPKDALVEKTPESTRSYLQKMILRQPPTGLASALRGMSSRQDTSSTLQNATIPILIITGDQDKIISSVQSEAMHKLAKNSRLVIIKNAGHLANLDQPQAWNQAVIDMFYSKNQVGA